MEASKQASRLQKTTRAMERIDGYSTFLFQKPSEANQDKGQGVVFVLHESVDTVSSME